MEQGCLLSVVVKDEVLSAEATAGTAVVFAEPSLALLGILVL
jgi:hypothetical protein